MTMTREQTKSNIEVHLLMFHRLHSHIEIVLHNTSSNPHTYYYINRWTKLIPSVAWFASTDFPNPNRDLNFIETIDAASSKFNFTITIDFPPYDIIWECSEYFRDTRENTSIFGNNCAVAVQWFLNKYAKIPEPNLSNVSFNHVALGIFWPSFIPCPVTLPGRVMANAKFHIDIRDNKEKIANQYSILFLHVAMASSAIAAITSALGIYIALNLLTGGLATVATATCIVTNLASTYGFFSAYNKLSAKRLAQEICDKKEVINAGIQPIKTM